MLLAAERRRVITERIQATGQVVVSALSTEFQVSEETIRRDLESLEKEGIATRIYGGAVLRGNDHAAPPYSIRKNTNIEPKVSIAQKLCELVQDHTLLQKEYLAVLSSPPLDSEGRLTDYLFHDKQKNKAFVTDGKRKGSKEAVLDYRVLSTLPDGHTLILVRLRTGRTHQIRVQFASRGLPLVGDGKYGSREKAPFIGLWAYRLTFPHPITGKELSVSAFPDTETTPWSLFKDQIPTE